MKRAINRATQRDHIPSPRALAEDCVKGQEVTLLTLDEAANRFRKAGLTDINRKWVSDQCDRRRIPCVVIARRRRVRSDVIENMIVDWLGQAAAG